MRPWTGGSFVLSLLLSLQLKVIFFFIIINFKGSVSSFKFLLAHGLVNMTF